MYDGQVNNGTESAELEICNSFGFKGDNHGILLIKLMASAPKLKMSVNIIKRGSVTLFKITKVTIKRRLLFFLQLRHQIPSWRLYLLTRNKHAVVIDVPLWDGNILQKGHESTQ
jgi:hypothetical protein